MPNHLVERVEWLSRTYFDRQADPGYFRPRLFPLLREAGYDAYENAPSLNGESPFYVRHFSPEKIIVVSPLNLFRDELHPAREAERRAELSCLTFQDSVGVEELVQDYSELEKLRGAEESLREKENSSLVQYPLVREVVNLGANVFPERVVNFFSRSSHVRRVLNTGAYGIVGYVLGAGIGIATAAVATEGSVVSLGLGGLLGNRLGIGVAVGLYEYRVRRMRREWEVLKFGYQEALTQFREKYASLAVLDKEGLLLAMNGE